jgi:selenocysteine lyase/cysteine desulfurase
VLSTTAIERIEREEIRSMQRRNFLSSVALSLSAVPGVAASFQEFAERVGTAENDQDLWKKVRQEFLFNPGLAHLNTGSLGATPRCVLDGVAGMLYQLEGDPVSNVFGPMGYRMEAVRARAASLLGATTEEVTVTENTTSGMNYVAQSLANRLKPGDEILTTTHEHPGGAVCWEYLVKTIGVKIVSVPMPTPVRDKAQILELVQKHITPRTRVCSFSHVDTITGLRMPIAEIAEMTRPKEIFLICDGAQAPGMLKIDVKRLGVDAYASSSHKWMLAPKGSGLLYIRKEMQDIIRPLPLFSGYQAYTGATGTRNVCQVLGHGLAMDFHSILGPERVEKRCRELSDRFRETLVRNKNLELLTPASDDLSTGMVSYKLKKGTAGDLYTRLLKEHEIMVKVVAKPEYNAIRLSTHIYNNESEIARAAAAIEKIQATTA